MRFLETTSIFSVSGKIPHNNFGMQIRDRAVEGLIELQWWSGGTLGKLFRSRPLEGRKTLLSEKTLLPYVLVYNKKFGSKNISVENAMILIAFRTIFEKSGGALVPASPMAAR